MLTKNLTIVVGATESDWLETSTILGTMKEADLLILSRLIAPDALTAVTSIGFESKYSAAGGTKSMKDIYGIAVSVAVSAAADVPVAPSAQVSLPPFIRLKANAAVAGADRIFTLGFRVAE